MLMFPTEFWPAGFWPQTLFPGDARRYEVMRRVTGGDDVLVASAGPGELQAVVAGIDNSAENFYVCAYNRVNLPDRDPIDGDLRLIAFDTEGDLIVPVPSAVRDLRLVAKAGGMVTAEWEQRSRRGTPAAASFNVYVATEMDDVIFTTPTHAGVVSVSRPRSLSLGTFLHGTVVKTVVRAVSADGAEETNTNQATATADSQSPAAVTVTSLGATPS